MVAINSFQALGSYQSYNNLFSLTKNRISSNGPSKPLSFPFARNASSQFAQTAASGIARILTSANKLNSSASAFRSTGMSSVLTKSIVGSASPTQVQPVSSNGSTAPAIKLNVQSIAKAQSNSGASFSASSPTSMSSRTQSFAITNGNKTTNISFYTFNTDTHKTALTKMRDAINKSDSGVTAAIITDPLTGKIHLDVASNETGAADSFTMADLSGNAVSSTGISSVTNTAEDAAYTIDDGTQQTSASNQIKLDNGKITVNLLKPTAGDMTITSKPDADAIVKQTKQVVDDYNDLQASTNDESGYLNFNVKKNLQNSMNSYALETLGLKKNSDGSLTLDENELRTNIAAKFDQVSKSFNGPNGIATALSKNTTKLQASPAEALLNRNNSDYLRYSNYQASLQFYSQMPSNGLLLNKFM